jgi:hypothetical protein
MKLPSLKEKNMLIKNPRSFKQYLAETFTSIVFLSLGLFTLSIISQAQVAPTVNDGHGKEWRMPQATFLSWNQTATICPQDGVSRCSGAIGTQDLDNWVWATDEQVLQLMSYYEPAMLTNRSVTGFQYSTGAGNFLNAFHAQVFTDPCSGYFCTGGSSQSIIGWTASKDSYGSPYLASSSLATFQGGSFSVFPAGATQSSGVWLWRDPNGIYANDDSGMVASPAGGTALSNVLANDRSGGATATLSSVFITQLSSTNTGVSVNAGNGSVNVAGPTPAGTYSLVYRICSNTNVTQCDDATVTVLVKPYTIDAVNDNATISPSVGGVALNVLSNDTFSGGGAAGNVSLSLVSLTPGSGITLSSNGSVNVAQGSALGTFVLTYQICANVQPTLCDTAAATILVKHYVIDAVNDYVRASSKINSSPINLLTNDTFNGGPATPAQVQITQLSGPTSGVTLNTATGLVSVVAKTTSGLYYINYKICEINAPTNCDTAIATIELSGK